MSYSNTFRVGHYTCTMTYDAGAKHLSCEGDPTCPRRGGYPVRKLTNTEPAAMRS
jgi:hypothetical protein